MRPIRGILFLAIAASGFMASFVEAVSLYRGSNFQDGTLQDWTGGADPNLVTSGGPLGAGDAYLRISSNGGQGPGSHLATHNSNSQYQGNYLATGAAWLLADFRNSIDSAPVEMRVGLFAAPQLEARFTSSVALPVPNDGQWHRRNFPLSAATMTNVVGNLTFDQVFSDVDLVMIRHDGGGPQSGGEPIVATLGIDNVRIVPRIDCAEVDGLVAAIAGGENPPRWDLTGDGLVNQADLQDILAIAGRLLTTSMNPLIPGDANLDGVVDGSDFNIWNANKFTPVAAWCSGDFNADGNVDGSDFNIWNANKFTASDGAGLVPEPSGIVLVAMALVARAFHRNRAE